MGFADMNVELAGKSWGKPVLTFGPVSHNLLLMVF